MTTGNPTVNKQSKMDLSVRDSVAAAHALLAASCALKYGDSFAAAANNGSITALLVKIRENEYESDWRPRQTIWPTRE